MSGIPGPTDQDAVQVLEIIWKAANGGQNVSCDFGGGKRTIECALQNQFWRPQKVGFAWSVRVSSKENNRAKTNWGGKRIIGGGVQKNRFWEGVLWYVFPSPEFSTPLCSSLNHHGPAHI